MSLIRRLSGKKSSRNMVINGENLATLAALKAGSGTSGQQLKVDLIYIDPPYNVGGNQGYRNIWKGKSEKERDWAGDHGAFLDFMEPRLKIGKALLQEDGIVMVSICDGEYCRLKILMDQVFGPDNCLGTVIWNKVQGAYGKHLTAIHEYILVYAKDASKAPRLNKAKESAQMMIDFAKELKIRNISHSEAKKEFARWVKDNVNKNIIGKSESYYNQLHPSTFEPFQATSMSAQDNPDGRRCKKPLVHPLTKKNCKVPPMGWKYSLETLSQMSKFDEVHIGDGFIVAGEIRYGMDENTIPRQAFPLREGMYHALPSVINIQHNQGKKDLPPGIDFSTPKPVSLIKELIKSFPKTNAVVLDYFAGSGATAQAVHQLNQEDGGQRSWIMVEELGSTFNNVLVPRIDYFDTNKDYAVYETDTADVSNKDLVKSFQKYSFDYLAAYKNGDEVEMEVLEDIAHKLHGLSGAY